jgi:small subunit ribosomal protein S1
MEELLAGSAMARLEPGQIVSGIVTEIQQNDVLVDIGAKCDGRIRLSEFGDPHEIQVGQKIEVYLEKLEDSSGAPSICYDRVQQQKNWERIAISAEEGGTVTGKIKGKTRGGLLVNIGVDAFLPSSQLDILPTKNIEQFIGRTYEFKIVKINRERKNIVVSRRELLEEERRNKSQELFERLHSGDIVKGVVKNITDYGAFVDLDGVDGLLHVTDMSWGRVTHPNQVVRVGEELTVMVLDIDRDKGRVSLGLKQTTANPWDNIEQRYPIGACVHGKVVNLVPYGAFVELENGVEGLVHVTEMSWTKKISKPSDILKISQEIEAVVLGIQKDEQKIALGLRQLEDNPWDQIATKYPVGSAIHGVVRSLTNYGAFIEIEPGVHGMVHISDVSWTRKPKSMEEVFKIGDEVDAAVILVDMDGHRIALSVRKLAANPWLDINDHFKVGEKVEGKIIKITNFGIFVELGMGIDGFIHIGQISENRVDRIRDLFNVGDRVTARIIRIEVANQRIALSIKAMEYDATELQREINNWKNVSASTTNGSGQSEFGTLGDLLAPDDMGV